jgi:hypothetical protein
VALALPIMAAQAGTARHWTVKRLPTNKDALEINSVACTSTCLVVGSQSTGFLADQLRGSKWVRTHVPNPPHIKRLNEPGLQDVSCSSATACTAVGESSCGAGVALRWTGSHWTRQRLASVKKLKACNVGIYAVSCPSRNRCMAGGYAGDSSQLVETWNGSKWSVLPSPHVSNGVITDLACLSADACAAVGNTPSGSFAEWWNGHRWKLKRLDYSGRFRVTYSLTSVSCLSKRSCFAVSNEGTLPLDARWNGKRWFRVVGPGDNFSQAVSCTHALGCVALGSNVSHLRFWNGRRWATRPTGLKNLSEFESSNLSCFKARCAIVGSRFTAKLTVGVAASDY